jgi:Tol biopolymer transport system component/DNA-binding winged helix-turn-helix (wHTH) protein
MIRTLQGLCEFGPFRLDPVKRLLSREGEAVTITPKAFDLLVALVESGGEVVTKDDLMTRIWPDSFVEEGNLTYNISILRKTLGERADEHQYIATVPGHGYQFVASVNRAMSRASDVSDTSESTTPSTGDRLLTKIKRQKPAAALALAAFLISALAMTLVVLRLIGRDRSNATSPLRQVSLKRLTSTGKANLAVISRDGKYVVYVLGEAGRQSLRVRQLATPADIQISPPAEVEYRGLSFSNDGSYIYYLVREKRNMVQMLYQMPVLGGAGKRILTDVDNPISFSPDGTQFTFTRFVPSDPQDTLMIANADGTAQRRIAALNGELGFVQVGLDWSPDGKTIACAVAGFDGGHRYETVIEVQVADGVQKPLTSQRWASVGRMGWLPNGRGLILTATDQNSSAAQIWHLSYPDGLARKVIDDLNDYGGVSLTSDASALVAVQTERISSVWMVPEGEASRARRITSGKFDGDSGISWTADGKAVYASNKNGDRDIWIINPDGGNQKQLTVDAGSNEFPSVSPDDRYIVFVSDRAGARNIWRMDIDGGNPARLTRSSYDSWPQCSPDGRWVFFTSLGSGKPAVWKVPIEGGEPVLLTGSLSNRPCVSPDGKLIACWWLKEDEMPVLRRLAIVPAEGGQPIRLLDLPLTHGTDFRWAADGRALMYIDTREGISNIWSQPINGGPARQLTDFNSDRIFRFDLSRDGKQLLCARGLESTDVVLISNFR